MRHWIMFMLLTGIVLALVGAACTDEENGETKVTPTATVEEVEATNTQPPPAPTDTPPPAGSTGTTTAGSTDQSG